MKPKPIILNPEGLKKLIIAMKARKIKREDKRIERERYYWT